jgi:hypothetical protein
MLIKIKKSSIAIALILSLFVLTAPYLSKASLVGNTNNATLALSPDLGVYRVGPTFPIDILVNTHGQNVVVVAAYLSYNPALFQIVSIDTTGSIFGTEAENIIDAVNGKIKITRGTPTPGVNVVNGKVATLNIKGLTDINPSSDNITFDFTAGSTNESNVILNDGLGTDIISGVYNGKYTLDGTPPANVSSFTAAALDSSIALSWVNPSSDFAGVTILRKTGSYPTNPTDGTLVYDNAGANYSDSGLTNGTIYYYTAFSRDIVVNYSSGAQASAAPRDGISPAAINTLSAAPLTAKIIRLNWTAVGDDGAVGTALTYDIRYSTAAITAGNWSSASQVSGAPTPKVSGSAETMTVGGLAGATTYYFAIKAVDEGGNASTISNVANAKTYKMADLNNDNYVNSVDFGILMSYWGNSTKPAADMNQDSAVNSVDFGIMMSQWG